jgi:heavy metal sensor kinase
VTLTNRLSLFFLATLAVVLVGFSVTLFLFVRMYLLRQSEERLDAALNALVASVEIGPHGLMEWEPTQRHLKLGPATFGEQIVWLVSDEKGSMVDRSQQAHAETFLAEASERLRTSAGSPQLVNRQGEHWQFGRRWVQPDKQAPARPHTEEANPKTDEKEYAALSITAGVPLDPVHVTLRQLAVTLIGLSTAIWTLALFAGRVICRRALLPVARMAASAREIDASNLEQRLPAVSSQDELEDLNRAINSLLDRLQDAFERQRRFTGDASHQLRTPLAAILGQLEVALRRQRSPAEYEQVLATVHHKAEHLRRIVESLLFLARADHDARLPERERIDLRSWLPEQFRAWSQQERGKDIRLESAGGDACAVDVQPALLGEMLNILIDNACKCSQPGTPIKIRLQRQQHTVDVQVEDQGCGIAASDLPYLFTPFFRSAETRRLGIVGCGLGLSIAKRLAGVFRGELTVTSRLGHGSCFTLRLPVDAARGSSVPVQSLSAHSS